MIGIQTVGLDKFQRILGHIENGVPRVVSRAMNRAIRSGRTELSRCTRAAFTIKQKDLYATLSFKNAGGEGMEAGIESRFSGMLPLAQFNVRPRARRKKQTPLSVNVRTGGGGTLGRAFWGTGKVLARRRAGRYPLTELKTISAPIMVSQPDVSEPTIKALAESYEKRADHEIGRLMAEAG